MSIVFFYCITCISAVSENTINTTTNEIDSQNNLISLSYDEQLKISAEKNNSALITKNENEILQQKNNEEILKTTNIKADTKIIGKDYTLNHKPMPFIVYLKDNNNNPLKDMNVIFTINGVDYTRTTANDGSAKININLNPGNYPITYSFAGNNNYKETSGKSTIKIVTNKLQPTLNGNDLSKYHDETGQYKTYLKDNNGNPLINELIQIKINGVTYTRTTGNDGDATLNINLPAGKYTITTNYNGNSYYNTASKTNTITVNKKTTTIQASDLTKYYGETTPYTIKIQDNNKKPLTSANIIFTVNGQTYSKTTENDGTASLNINLKEGKYTITTTFNENDDYKKSTITKTVTINKKTTTLKGSDLTKYVDETKAYAVTLLDNQNKAIKNTQITLNVNGVDYTKNTDNNGKTTLNINLPAGKYTITTKYLGNDYYKTSTTKNTITVNKKATSIQGSDMTKYVDETKTYTATLIDNQNNPIKNTQITININRIDYIKNTDNNGKAVLNINLQEGTYTIKTIFNGNDKYSQSTTSNTIKIIKKNSILKADDLTKFVTENTKFKIQLCGNNNEKLANKNIIINVNNKNYNKITDKNGYAYLNINLPVGNYVITSKFNGDDNYKKSTIKNTIIIKYPNPSTPIFNIEEGHYDVNNLVVNISAKNPKSTIFYTLNNGSTWHNQTKNVCLNLPNGNWTIQSYTKENGKNSQIITKNYIIDNKSPIVLANYESGTYKNTLKIKLSTIDNTDPNPKIYYSINKSNFRLYTDLIEISKTTSLRFYAIDSTDHKSEIVTCNYIFEKIGNLNTGEGFKTIQEAINNKNTHNGDTIMVSEGLYKEKLTINKNIHLITNNATLQSTKGSYPAIEVTNGGSNSIIQGFKIKDSTFGIVINQTENITIINNQFINVVSSIETVNDKNTIITHNSIDSNKILNSMTGITVRKSDNLMILNNNITLYSNKDTYGIIILNNTSNNISIVNNKITNKYELKGIGLQVLCSNTNINSNNISNLEKGLYMISSNSKILHNEFKNNQYGIFLKTSINNTYAFNNIHSNKLYGFVLDKTLISHDDSFYLNRLCNNKKYDLYSQAKCPYLINNNWWGENTPKISTNRNIGANIYNKTGNLIMNTWVVAKLFSSSYKINEYSQIERAKLQIDLTYNNLGNKLSHMGYIPNNLESFISVFNNDANKKSNTTYLKDGEAFVDFELTTLFKKYDKIHVMAIFDNEKIVNTLNKNATIDITLFSFAWDVDNNYFVNKTYHIPFTNNASWITFSWGETGLYTGKIYMIVNGEIIDEINIHNLFYQRFKNNYSKNVFEAIKLLNNVFASMKEGVWAPNGYYLDFAKSMNIDARNFNLVYNEFLNYLKSTYHLTNSELDFIKNHNRYFIDKIEMIVDYHGDITPDINFEYNGKHELLNLPSSYAHRISNIYYTDIEDENGISIGYEGMRSFAIAKSNVTDNDLRYWLNQKDSYAPGLMKAAYGTFLTPLLVIYENDRVADESANKFNVTWNRITPSCVSLCNDYNSLYITGESNHLMGRGAKGNISDVWKFNFATSFSFSLIEQLVGNNIWNSTIIGSVTLGLIESYMNNKTLEIFNSNGHVFIKHADDNTTLLFLDLQTGTVRDCFTYYGLLGTMPCYHDKITDNAWKYGNNLLDETSVSYLQLDSIADYSTSVALIGGVFASDSLLVAGETISAATLTTVGSILFVIALPIVFELSRPKLAEMLNNMGYHEMAQYYHTNNTLDIIWDAIEYFTTGELENVPYEQKLMFSLFYLSNLNLNYMFIGNMIINPNSDLYKLLNLTIFLLKSPDFDKQKEIIDNELKIIGNHGYDGIPSSPSPIERHGEKLRIAYEHAKLCWKAGNYVEFLKNWLIMDFIISITFAEIIDAWGEEIIDLLTGLENTSKG